MSNDEFSKRSNLQMDKAEFHRMLENLESEACGRNTLLTPLVTDENGSYDDDKARELISELLYDMDRYGYENGLWLGHITSKSALPAQKSFCRYVRLYLYLAIRMSLLDMTWTSFLTRDLPDATFNTILRGCHDFASENDKDSLLFWYYVDGYIGDAGIITWCSLVYEFMHPGDEISWMSDAIQKRMNEIGERECFEDEAEDENDSAGLNLDDIDPFDMNVDEWDVPECDIDEFCDGEFICEDIADCREYDAYGEADNAFKCPGNLAEQLGDLEEFSKYFKEFVNMIYSDEVPYSYLSVLRSAICGMLDVYMSNHRKSIYSSPDDMNKTVVYVNKVAEKVRLLNRQRDK